MNSLFTDPQDHPFTPYRCIPLQDNCVDVIISNCVINLSTNKGQVLREAYRVLKPGGRFAISDIVFQLQYPVTDRGNEESMASLPVTPDPDNANRRAPNTASDFAPSQIPAALRADLESWAGCIAGALEEETYRQLLSAAGFTDIEVEVTRRYALDDISESGAKASIAALTADERNWVDGKLVSAFIRARKPQDKE